MRRLAVAMLVLGACRPADDGGETGVVGGSASPEALITFPTAGAELRAGADPVSFTGFVTDADDAPSALDVTWTLDGGDASYPVTPKNDGAVQLELLLAELAEGSHELALTVVDPDGRSDTALVVWRLVTSATAPVPVIAAPIDGAVYERGVDVVFLGSATDDATDPAELTLAWKSDVDGVLDGATVPAEGASELRVDDLSVGVHTVTLTATDADGELGVDAIEVEIVEPSDMDVAARGDVVISELMINPAAVYDDVGEWVELYNPTANPVDISGFSLHDLSIDDVVLDGDLVVPAGGFLVLCASDAPIENGGVPCDGEFDRTGAGGFALGNSGDEVVLARPDGVVIDEVVYSELWVVAGAALGLSPAHLDADDNDVVDVWCAQTTVMVPSGEPGTPGVANDPCP